MLDEIKEDGILKIERIEEDCERRNGICIEIIEGRKKIRMFMLFRSWRILEGNEEIGKFKVDREKGKRMVERRKREERRFWLRKDISIKKMEIMDLKMRIRRWGNGGRKGGRNGKRKGKKGKK